MTRRSLFGLFGGAVAATVVAPILPDSMLAPVEVHNREYANFQWDSMGMKLMAELQERYLTPALDAWAAEVRSHMDQARLRLQCETPAVDQS